MFSHFAGRAGWVAPANRGRARSGLKQTCEHFDGSGLARAIGSQAGADCAPINRECQSVDCRKFPKAPRQILAGDHPFIVATSAVISFRYDAGKRNAGFSVATLVLLMPSWVSAQEPGSITRTASDLSGEVRLPGAIVRLLRASDKTEVAGVRAGTDGQFRIEGVPPERYQVTVDMPEFRRFSIDRISISPGQHLSLPVLQLEPGMWGNQRPGDASMSHIAVVPPESGIAVGGTIGRRLREDRLRIRLQLHLEGCL